MTKKRIFKIIGILSLLIGVISMIFVSWFIYQIRQYAKEGAPFVLDQIFILEQKNWNSENYILSRIISGFQDKIEEVALFKGNISYYKWGNPIYDNIEFRELIDQKMDKDGHSTRIAVKGHLEFEKDQIRIDFDNGEEQIFRISKSHSHKR